MRQASLTGLALTLSVFGLAAHASDQLPPQPLAAVSPTSAPAPAPQFTPAPVPSHAFNGGSSTQAHPPGAPLAPGSARLRLNGSVTSYIGVGADSGRNGR